jgi:hypothetical protein
MAKFIARIASGPGIRPAMPARPATGPTTPDQPARSSDARRSTAATLKAEIEMLQAKVAELEAMVADRRTAFHAAAERGRAECLLADLLRMTAELMSAREASARLEGELEALRSQRNQRPWWWRILTG